MNGISSFLVQFLHSVGGFAHDIHQASFDLLAYGHRDGATRREYLHTPSQSIGTFHGYGTYGIFSDVLLNFQVQYPTVLTLDGECIVNARQKQGGINVLAFEIYIHHRADDLRYASDE